MRDDRSERRVYNLSFNLTQIFQFVGPFFDPAIDQQQGKHNRRNNNQEYLELNIGAPRSINRAKQRVVALIPSNDPAHSKRRHDLIFQNILREILDIHRGRMGGKGMWNRRLKLGGKERKEEGGKKIPFLPPVDLVGIPWSPCANPGNRCFSWWSRELGRGTHKREI